ncbi:MAG: twin-arginine translocase TatA/TatE family subunit [Proteobacteria bacterium]|nr:twin-arginine translocase TatA/TatE family subunit [Pseudomonadota bacterium]
MGGWTGIWQWVVVLVIVLLLFGRGKIPGLMGDMAKGLRAFKKGLKEDDEEATAKAPPKALKSETPPPADASFEASLKGHEKDSAAKG